MEPPARKNLDAEITSWILEFIIRQPQVSDVLINKFLLNDAVPCPPTDTRLKRTIILRSIESEISNGSVSEKTLDSMEILQRLDREEGKRTPDGLKAAYCAVAVECAVKYLGGSPSKGGGGGKGKYFEAVERVWRGRVEAEDGGLVGEEMRMWKDEVEAAVWDPGAARRLVERNTRNDALRLVGDYLGEAMAGLGPPFLEVVARRLRERKDEEGVGGEDNVGSGDLAVNDRRGGDDAVEGTTNLPGRLAGKEIQKKNGRPRVKHVASCRLCRRGATIIDSEEEAVDPVPSKYDTLPSVEVNKVKEALKSSSVELQMMVKDPLPDAIRLAETLVTGMGKRIMEKETSTEKQNADAVKMPDPSANSQTSEMTTKILHDDPSVERQNGNDIGSSNPPVNGFTEPFQRVVGDATVPSSSNQNDAPKQSLMERNSTAQVYEWEDSIDGSPEATTNGVTRRRLDSGKRKAVSPLKKYEITKFARRRPIKKWTVEEEDALREGVQKFGKGSWKLILNSRRDVFAERTEVDLKDKWRNMTRY